MSSSPDAVLRGTPADAVQAWPHDTELRSGTWTRLGRSGVLGDGVTESALSTLAESTRAAARAQGYSVGWAEGRRASEERGRADAETEARRWREHEDTRAQEHSQAVSALHRAVERLQETGAEVCARIESQTVDIAMVLAEAVLGREIALAEDPGADAVRRALRLLPNGTTANIRLHPADLASLGSQELSGTNVTAVEDPSLQRGDAVVETPDSMVDATVATALTRVRDVLTGCAP